MDCAGGTAGTDCMDRSWYYASWQPCSTVLERTLVLRTLPDTAEQGYVDRVIQSHDGVSVFHFFFCFAANICDVVSLAFRVSEKIPVKLQSSRSLCWLLFQGAKIGGVFFFYKKKKTMRPNLLPNMASGVAVYSNHPMLVPSKRPNAIVLTGKSVRTAGVLITGFAGPL